MTDTELFIILIVHWLLDFVFQTHYEATNKSKNFNALISHTLTYSAGWILFLVFFSLYNALAYPFTPPPTNQLLIDICIFGVITFVIHTMIDYITSKQTAKLFIKQDYHNFFVLIGFDQILHYLQLWFTFKLLL